MSQDLLINETHFSELRGTLKTATSHPVDGDEIENIQAGDMYFNDFNQTIYFYTGSAWYGKSAIAS